MKISNNWLKEYINTDLKPNKIGEMLTDIGLEVEGIEVFENIKGGLNGIVVGKILSVEKHPNADKLKITRVDIGATKPLNIVCGAGNVAEGQIVAVATIGAQLYDKNGNILEIKETKIREELSQGMICSEKELSLGEDNSGILILDDSYKIGDALSNYFEITTDHIFEIGLTPNRTDAMSHYGVARDLNAYLSSNQIKSEFEKIKNSPLKTSKKSKKNIEIEVLDPDLIPRYSGITITGVKVEPSPQWLLDKLQSIGVQAVNNIVDITNYILHALGQPLHAFDLDKIEGKKLIISQAEPSQKITTLDRIERELVGGEIIIKNENQTPLCIGGVMGGENVCIDENTINIFIESAYFNPISVRKTAKQHGINTDSSFRFERGVDPNMVVTALTHAVSMILEIAGGEILGEMVDIYPKKIENFNVILRYSKLDQILGIKIHREEIKKLLKFLDIDIINEIQNGLELSVPPYRADVSREIDVIEEILRIYGYNKIDAPQKISFTPIKLNADNQDALENSWANILQSQGFYEVMNNSLTSEKAINPEKAIKLLNPLSSDLAFMRTSLLEGLLDNTLYNINRKKSNIKFFELGKIYYKENNQYAERKQLAILISGKTTQENWLSASMVSNFYHIKSYVLLLLERLNLSVEEKYIDDKRFSDAIGLFFSGELIAKIGKVSPNTLKNKDLSQDCYYGEIEIEKIEKLRSKENFVFQDIAKFNIVRRDLALLIDKNISYAELCSEVYKNPSPYLKKINLFDVYEGDKIPEGKKSYAMSFELLKEEKTLEEKEINEVMNHLISLFENKFSASLRT